MTTEGEGAAVPAQPTDRHRRLAEQLLADAGWYRTDVPLAEAIAELLAAEDARRVPIAAAGAAYQRGRGDVIRAVRAELARDTSADAGDGPFDFRLRRLLDNLEAAPRD